MTSIDIQFAFKYLPAEIFIGQTFIGL